MPRVTVAPARPRWRKRSSNAMKAARPCHRADSLTKIVSRLAGPAFSMASPPRQLHAEAHRDEAGHDGSQHVDERPAEGARRRQALGLVLEGRERRVGADEAGGDEEAHGR